MPVYSFPDITASINIPDVGTIQLGAGAGHMEGGMSVTMTEDKNTMTVGADGVVMHSLHAGRSGMVTLRLLKTAEVNGTLSEAYNRSTRHGRAHGRAKILIKDWRSAEGDGDQIECTEVAFAKFADITYAKEGGEMVWTFHCGHIVFKLGPKPTYEKDYLTWYTNAT